ncbi:hypothetical protein ACFQUU_17930 [Herbaspirillum sp. GCM10030257]
MDWIGESLKQAAIYHAGSSVKKARRHAIRVTLKNRTSDAKV